MDQNCPEIAQSVFKAIALESVRIAAGLIPGGSQMFDIGQRVFDNLQGEKYVTKSQLRDALSKLSPPDRTALREETIRQQDALAPDHFQRFLLLIPQVEQSFYEFLFTSAVARDFGHMHEDLIDALGKSNYKEALTTVNKMRVLHPSSSELLKLQLTLEEKTRFIRDHSAEVVGASVVPTCAIIFLILVEMDGAVNAILNVDYMILALVFGVAGSPILGLAASFLLWVRHKMLQRKATRLAKYS